MTRELTAWFEQERVGTFAQADDGKQSFRYAASWLAKAGRFPISLSMPLGEQVLGDRITRAFFGGLLPDDELRRRLARLLQVSPHNEFALLAEVGRECAGAIALLPAGEEPTLPTGEVRALTDEDLSILLRELPVRPLLVGRDVRLSLAGAQDKIALRVTGDGSALPTDGGPTTHIVKTPIAGYPDTVANECFCMQLAAASGLPVPLAVMRRIGEVETLWIERFDRERTANGGLRRLHQEDFCQALGIPPELKYQAEGGPGFTQMFDLLTRHSSRPAVDRLQLLEMVVFHHLIGNADAHGKNYSLLLGTHSVRLAPVYDAMCTRVYPGLSSRMAMKIGSRREFDEVEPEHWLAFAKAVGLAPAIVAGRLRKLAQALSGSAQSLREGNPVFAASVTVAAICDCIAARCRAVLTG